MTTSLQSFNDELVRRVVRFLWRQWGQVGLAAADVEPRDGWIIDPEALLLVSATFARHDPRLFDEIMDWLIRNAAFINIPRLKSLHRLQGFAGLPVIAAQAACVMGRHRRLNWRLPPSAPTGGGPEPLFLEASGRPLPDTGPADPLFLQAGFKRGRVDLRGLSRRFNPVMPECALLRLRALFGVTARADVLLYLLTHDLAHPSGVARETGFSQKNVQDTLVDMAASGMVHVAHLEGRMKSYFVKQADRSSFLPHPDTPGLMPRWITWAPVFRALEILHLELRRLEAGAMSDLLLASELRGVMERLRPLAQRAGTAALLADGATCPGEAYATAFFAEIHRWLAAVLGESPAAGDRH